MSIPSSHFVNVIPGVVSAGGTALDLNGLFLTGSTRAPIGTVVSLASPSAVSAYFGPTSTEYNASVVYFGGFVNCTKYPGAMLFAQYPGSSTACSFTGTISTTTLTVSAVSNGALAVGQVISGSGVTAGTTITALGTGTGGAGTYTINVSQTVGSPTAMTAASPGVAAYLRGGSLATLGLAGLQAITSGTLSVVVDGYTHSAASVNLSSATSFSSAATLLTTALSSPNPTVASYTASITTNVMTVTVVGSGTIAVGQTVTGGTTAANTVITALGTGTGGTGTYIVSISQSVTSGSLTSVGTLPTVTYDTIGGGFVVTSGVTGAASTIAFATGTVAATLLLTSATGAVTSQGAAATTPSAFMTALALINQNWATFSTTILSPDAGVGTTQRLAFAAWTNGQGNRYAYIVGDTDASPTTSAPATSSLGYLVGPLGNNYSGICPVYETASTNNHVAFVQGFTASLDFERFNGRATLAYKSQTGLAGDVVSLTVATNLEANNYNYYGATATANDAFVFMYDGSITGPFLWFDSYINQIWLNNQFQLALMELLVNNNSIPYNQAGYSMIEAACLDPINAALNFGAIRAGVTLSAAQIATVNNAAGKQIDKVISTRGWYLQVSDASPQVRAARGTPPCTFWYADGQSVQQITLASLEVQ